MENVSEVKLAKFEIMLKEASYWFYSYSIPLFGTYYPNMPFCLPLSEKESISKYLENPYFKKVYNTCFLEAPIMGIENPNTNNINGPEPNSLVYEIRKLKNTEEYNCYLHGSLGNYNNFKAYQIRGGMIFLALLLAAVNDDFYSNEINMVSDLAYMLGFSEDMMSDWIGAVKYLLDGNMFSKDMPIEFKTPEANLFFKHRKTEEVQ